MRTFRIYEVEHQGDEDGATSALYRAGCRNIRVLERDYEGEESILVSADIPEDCRGPNWRQLLNNKVGEGACL